ncbi:MAG: hypothetical protein ACKESB_01435, partial [Candidatus Hodgkinia cicadicola]
MGPDPDVLLRGLKLKADRRRRGEGRGPFRTPGTLEPLADSIHDSIACGCGRPFMAGARFVSAVNVMINNLYHAVICLTFLCTDLRCTSLSRTCTLTRV